MALKVIPERIFLPLATVKLGRYVTDIARPHDSYHDAPIDPPQIATQYTISGRQTAASDAAFSTTLTSLLSTGLSKRIGATIELALSTGNTYFLDNSESWFDKTITFEETRYWMERQAKRKRTVYIIVGYQTIVDAKVTQSAHNSHSGDGMATVPIAASLAATGVVIPVPGLIDPKLGIRYAHANDGKLLYMTSGEQVCAIHYREVKYKFLSSSINNTQLTKTRQWFCMDSKISSGEKRAWPTMLGTTPNRTVEQSAYLEAVVSRPQAQPAQAIYNSEHAAAAYYPAYASAALLPQTQPAKHAPRCYLKRAFSSLEPADFTISSNDSHDVLDNFDLDAFQAPAEQSHGSGNESMLRRSSAAAAAPVTMVRSGMLMTDNLLPIDHQAPRPRRKRARPTRQEQQACVARQKSQSSENSNVQEDFWMSPIKPSPGISDVQPDDANLEGLLILEVDLVTASPASQDWILAEGPRETAQLQTDPLLAL